MIELEDVSVRLGQKSLKTTVFDGVTATIPTNKRVVLLGKHQSGKSTLIQLLAGAVRPSSGVIRRFARVSFPIGFAGGFRLKSTLRQNISQVCDIYGVDLEHCVGFVSEIAGIRDFMDEPLASVPAQVRARFLFAVSYAIPFDVYLADNLVAVGDEEFRNTCNHMLDARCKDSGLILATRDIRIAKKYGDVGGVIADGTIKMYDDVAQAIEAFGEIAARS